MSSTGNQDSPRAEASFKSPPRRNPVAKAFDQDRLPSSVACRSQKQQREDRWREEFQDFKAENNLSDDTKVFAICPPGGYQDVRDALEERGWFENTEPGSGCYDFKYVIRAKDLKNPPPVDQQQLNHFFNGGCLTTKTGLTASMKQLKWYRDFHQDEIFPRAYNISNPSDRQEWEIDFRWTAAEALLRRVQIDQGLHPAGVPVDEANAVDCAIKVLQARQNHMKHLRDPDLDWMGESAPCLPNLSEAEWSSILDCSYFNFELSGAESIPTEQVTAEGAAEEGDDDGGDDESDTDEPERNDGDDPEAEAEPDPDPEPEEVSPEDRLMGCGSSPVEAWDASDAMDIPTPMSNDGNAADANSSTPMDPVIEAEGPTEDSSKDQQPQAGEQAPETQAAREERYKDVKPEPVSEMTMMLIDQLLAEIKETNPQYNLNGTANIWILKPGGKSRGRGIRCVNKLRDVQRLADSNLHNNTVRARTGKKKTMWVVQKYMENPLTIRRRKFDIRQWVLVTDWNPLTIWFYDACYLRFAAEDYSLADFQNRFSHLTNNTIQIKSSEFEENDIGEGNMWDNERFAQWLGDEYGQPDAFQEKIQPAMRKCIEASLSTVQDTIKPRKGTHELFGYDFIIDEDLGTWFLEVNCSPCLAHSTPVTGRLVSSMVEDMMKVLVDLPDARRQARRGEFNIDEFDTGLWKRTEGSCGNSVVKQQAHVLGMPMQIQGSAVRIKRRRQRKLTADQDVGAMGCIPAKSQEAAEQPGSPASNSKADRRRTSPPAAEMPAAEVAEMPAAEVTVAEVTSDEVPADDVPADEVSADVAVVQKEPPPVFSLLKEKISTPTGLFGPFSGNTEFERHVRGTNRKAKHKIYGHSSSTGMLKRHESQLRSLTPVSAYTAEESPEPPSSEMTRACGSLSGNYGQFPPSPTTVANPRERYRFDSPSPVSADPQGYLPACLPKRRALQPSGSLKALLDRNQSSNDGTTPSGTPSSADSKAGGGPGRYTVLKPVTAALQKQPSSTARPSMLRSPEQREVNQWRLQLKGILNRPSVPMPMPIPSEGLQEVGERQVRDDSGCSSDPEPQMQQSPSTTPFPATGPAGPDDHLQLPLRLQQEVFHDMDKVSDLLETANMKRRLVNEYAKKLQYRQLPQAPVRKVGANLREFSLAGSNALQLRKSASLPRGPGMASARVIRPLGLRQLSAVSSSLPNSLNPPQLEKCWDSQPLGKTSYVSTRADEAIQRLVGISQ